MSRIQNLLSQLPKLTAVLPELETFTIFSKLPSELRARVWRFAAMHPSEIFFQRRRDGFAGQSLQPNGPAILYACWESREEAKKYYTPCRMTRLPPPPPSNLFQARQPSAPPFKAGKATVWINFSSDSFVFGDCFVDRGTDLALSKAFDFDDSIMSRIQNLVIKTNGQNADGLLIECLTTLENLLRHGIVKSLLVKLMVTVNCNEGVFLSRILRKVGRNQETFVAIVARRRKWAVPTIIEVSHRRKVDLDE